MIRLLALAGIAWWYGWRRLNEWLDLPVKTDLGRRKPAPSEALVTPPSLTVPDDVWERLVRDIQAGAE